MQRVGSRAQVMHGNAKQTAGGLKKKDLKYNKQGKIVSKKMSVMAKKEKRLQKAGYITKKGQFGAVRSMRGGGGETAVNTLQYDVQYILGHKEMVNHNRWVSKNININFTNNTINIDSNSYIYIQYDYIQYLDRSSTGLRFKYKPNRIDFILTDNVLRISFNDTSEYVNALATLFNKKNFSEKIVELFYSELPLKVNQFGNDIYIVRFKVGNIYETITIGNYLFDIYDEDTFNHNKNKYKLGGSEGYVVVYINQLIGFKICVKYYDRKETEIPDSLDDDVKENFIPFILYDGHTRSNKKVLIMPYLETNVDTLFGYDLDIRKMIANKIIIKISNLYIKGIYYTDLKLENIAVYIEGESVYTYLIDIDSAYPSYYPILSPLYSMYTLEGNKNTTVISQSIQKKGKAILRTLGIFISQLLKKKKNYDGNNRKKILQEFFYSLFDEKLLGIVRLYNSTEIKVTEDLFNTVIKNFKDYVLKYSELNNGKL
jgi:hypothetical protein